MANLCILKTLIDKNMKKFVWICAAAALAMAVSSCDADTGMIGGIGGKTYDAYDGYGAMVSGEGAPSSPSGDPSGEGGQGENTEAGKVTAGEWNDLEHWDFWGNLMLSEDFAEYSDYWKFFTNNRFAFTVFASDGKPAPGVKVSLLRGGKELWSAMTCNDGRADCWAGLFQIENIEDASDFSVRINGKDVDKQPVMSTWEQGVTMNTYSVSSAPKVTASADIAFIVDATGSMTDEIDFLKQDLMDILKKAEASQADVKYHTAALFYRDEGDKYVTLYSNFTAKASETSKFIEKQSADGGGDYPEAVHTALEVSLQSLSWSEDARARIAFMLLDAPAHHNEDVIASLQKSIAKYAAKGIRLIPVAASGVDKNTEFMLRFFSAATCGTYVFITNDSGIGNDHIEATVGDYDVELLNELITRLIVKYTK